MEYTAQDSLGTVLVGEARCSTFFLPDHETITEQVLNQ
jgi:hypothetical protein